MTKPLSEQREIVYDPVKATWTITLPNLTSLYSNEFSKEVFTIKQNDTMTPTEALKEKLSRYAQIAAQLVKEREAMKEKYTEELETIGQRIWLNQQQAAQYEAAILALGGSVSEMNLAALKK